MPSQLKQEIGADSIKLQIAYCERDKSKAKELLKGLTGVTQVLDAGPEDCLNVFANRRDRWLRILCVPLTAAIFGLLR